MELWANPPRSLRLIAGFIGKGTVQKNELAATLLRSLDWVWILTHAPIEVKELGNALQHSLRMIARVIVMKPPSNLKAETNGVPGLRRFASELRRLLVPLDHILRQILNPSADDDCATLVILLHLLPKIKQMKLQNKK